MSTYTNDFKDMPDADSAMAKRAQREVVKAAVMRQMFCPFSDKVLDQKTAVVIILGATGKTIVMDASIWDEKHEEVAALATKGFEVYDGREVW